MDDQQEEMRRKYKIFHVDLEIFKNPGISQKIHSNPKKSRDIKIWDFSDQNKKIPGFGIPEKSHPTATSGFNYFIISKNALVFLSFVYF